MARSAGVLSTWPREPYEIHRSAGAFEIHSGAFGRGWVATKDLRAGTPILVEKPFYMAHNVGCVDELLNEHPGFVSAAEILGNDSARARLQELHPRSAAEIDAIANLREMLCDAAAVRQRLLEAGPAWAHLAGVSEAEFARACAAVELNAFNTKRHVESGIALFQVACFLNHSCWPNCRWALTDAEHMAVYAAVDIPAGSPLTIAYRECWYPTGVRRGHLAAPPLLLDCGCPRCLGAEPRAAEAERAMMELAVDAGSESAAAFEAAHDAFETLPPTLPAQLELWARLRAAAAAAGAGPAHHWLHEARVMLATVLLLALKALPTPQAAEAAAALAEIAWEDVAAFPLACPFVSPQTCDVLATAVSWLQAAGAGGYGDGGLGGGSAYPSDEARARHLRALSVIAAANYDRGERGDVFHPFGCSAPLDVETGLPEGEGGGEDDAAGLEALAGMGLAEPLPEDDPWG